MLSRSATASMSRIDVANRGQTRSRSKSNFLSYLRRHWLEPDIAHCEHRDGSYEADEANDEKRRDVASPGGTRHAGGEGGDRTPQLMAGENPTDDDRRFFGAEMLRG